MNSTSSNIKFIRTFGMSIWVSFISSGIAVVIFFATFDPQVLGSIATFPIELSSEAGYTLGFLLFWLLLVANSWMVLFLARKP